MMLRELKPSWILVSLVTLLVILVMPFGIDNAVFQSMSLDLLRYGRWPYAGSWDHSFPAIIILHVTSIVLFGNSQLGFRFLDLLIQIPACYMLYRLWRLWLSPRVAWIAVFLYVLAYVRGSTEMIGQRDVYATLLTLWASYLLLRERTYTLGRLIAIGLLFGLATAFRPTYIVYAAIAIGALPWTRTVRTALTVFAASSAPLAVFVLIYALAGKLNDAYLAMIRFNADLYTTFGADIAYFYQQYFFYQIPLIFLAAFWFIPNRWRDRVRALHVEFAPNRPTVVLYAVSFILTTIFILWQHKYLRYHFYPIYTLLTPLAALTVEALLTLLPSQAQLATLVVVGLLGALPKAATIASLHAAQNGRSWKEAFDDQINCRPGIGYEWERAALRYLNRPENADGRIEVIGFNSILRADLGRESATRFTMTHSIGYRTDTSRHFDERYHTPYQRVWRVEFVDSIERVRPRFIVLIRESDSWYLKDPYRDVLHELPRFDQFFFSNYSLDTTIGKYEIYRIHPDLFRPGVMRPVASMVAH